MVSVLYVSMCLCTLCLNFILMPVRNFTFSIQSKYLNKNYYALYTSGHQMLVNEQHNGAAAAVAVRCNLLSTPVFIGTGLKEEILYMS